MSTSFNRRFLSAALVLMTGAALLAILRAWLTDDAFISFRYARNLVEGHGLVYNPGERVEGYSNFLWTLWCALGLGMRIPAEIWAQIWGVVFYTASIGLLAFHLTALQPRIGLLHPALPLTMLLAVLHEDWSIFATGGLETSAFTFLILCAYLLLVAPGTTSRRSLLAGLVMALATLTRPDGIVFAGVGGLFVLTSRSRRIKLALIYTAGFAVLLIPFLAWRVWYYDDLLPNTYYAKSAHLAWWDQGWHYAGLYFKRYWPLLLGLVSLALLAVPRLVRPVSNRPLLLRSAALAAGFALAYTAAIARLGGDFMFARMLIPATPFYLILTGIGLMLVTGAHRWLGMGLGAALLAGLILTPSPVTPRAPDRGVTNEWMYHQSRIESRPDKPLLSDYLDHRAAVLGRYLSDLPVRVAFLGDEARVMYQARIPVAIESTTGLTDRHIARRKLEKRGWIGHEKPAPEEYLTTERKVHFTFSPRAAEFLKLGRTVIPVRIELDDVKGYVLYWDPEVMTELKRRGARFTGIADLLDGYIARLDQLDDATVARDYRRLTVQYFDHVNDPARESAFRRRLGLPEAPRP